MHLPCARSSSLVCFEVGESQENSPNARSGFNTSTDRYDCKL